MKVFGIGLSKTGTTSLANALEILGYKVKDCLGVTTYTKGDLRSVNKAALATYDAFTDTPIPSFYRDLDEDYPNSKFILTVRDMDAWLKSCKKQFNQKLSEKRTYAANQLFLDLYDTVVFDEKKFRKGYEKFTNDALEYFKDRPDDFIIIDISKGEGWEKLCPFLNKPQPAVLFPKSNVTQIKWLDIHQVAQNIRRSALKSENNLKDTLYAFFCLNKNERIKFTAEKVEQLINKELTKLYANIPIISKNKHDIPIENRKSWHHYWLVDCSESSNLVDNKVHGYVINVALIEDGIPYIGIVYSPSYDVLYYSAIDKGAFKAINNKEPIPMTKNHLKATQELDNNLQEISNIGWKLCQSTENSEQIGTTFEESREWHTAAGHAILMSIGLNLVETSNNQILKYNKTDWLNPVVKLIK